MNGRNCIIKLVLLLKIETKKRRMPFFFWRKKWSF